MPTPAALPDPHDWPLLPGPCLPLDEDEAAHFRECLQHYMMGSGLDLANASASTIHALRALPLSFYPGFLLVTGDVQLPEARVGSVDVLMGPGLFAVLDGTRTLIQALNAGRLPQPTPASAVKDAPRAGSRARRAPRGAASCYPSPLLSFETHLHAAADYLRFFCSAVRGPSGSFRLIETEAQLHQCRVKDPSAWLPQLKPLVLAPHRDEQGLVTEGLFSGRALMLYGGDMHEALLCVHEGGLVAMPSDQSLGEGVAPSEVVMGPLRNIRPVPTRHAGSGQSDPSTSTGDKP